MTACKETERNALHFYHEKSKIENEKLKIVEYIVKKIGFERLDLLALCQQACSSKYFQIAIWFLQKMETPNLDVYTTINSALDNKRSDILEYIMNKIEIASLDKREVLKSVSEHYTAGCSAIILEIVRTIWNSTEDKKVLQMEEIENTLYERKCFELLIWIHENCHPHMSIDARRLLMSACGDCRVDVAKWVLQAFEQTSLDINGGTLFVIACSEKNYLECDIILEHRIEIVNKLVGTLHWILETFPIQRLDIISGVLKLISVGEKIRNELYNLIVSILDKYSSCINTEDMKEIINTCLKLKYYVLVNWFLEKRSSCSCDKQMILNKACTDAEIETLKILSKSFSVLDMNQSMINVCTSAASIYDVFTFVERGYDKDQSVACLDLLLNEIDNVSIDIRTIASTVCKENVSNNVMTWILLNLPREQIPINEVLITCCQQSKIHHVKYIVHEFAIDKLDTRKAFVEVCHAFPENLMFQLQKSELQCVKDVFQSEMNEPTYLMIVDSLFQMQRDKGSCVDLVLYEISENKKFRLILYFLQAGYCRNINMNDLLNDACRYGQVKLVQWIVTNVGHEELDTKSAFHKTCDGVKHDKIYFFKQENHVMCVALMWHYIHDINMFTIDTVSKTMTESNPGISKSDLDDEFKTWLLYIKNMNQRTCLSENVLLSSEKNINQQSQQVNDEQCCIGDPQDNNDVNSRDLQDDCPSPTKRVRLEKEEQT